MLIKFIKTCDEIYKQEFRDFIMIMNQYLISLLTYHQDKSCRQSLVETESEARFSDEIKYEMEIRIEAEKSLDEDEKEFNSIRDTFIQEYVQLIEGLLHISDSQLDIYELNK